MTDHSRWKTHNQASSQKEKTGVKPNIVTSNEGATQSMIGSYVMSSNLKDLKFMKRSRESEKSTEVPSSSVPSVSTPVAIRPPQQISVEKRKYNCDDGKSVI